MILNLIYFSVIVALCEWAVEAAKIEVTVWYPEESLDYNFVDHNQAGYRLGYIFGFSVVTCQAKQGYNLNPRNEPGESGPVYGPLVCPGGEYAFDPINYGINASDKDPIVKNKWTKTFELGEEVIWDRNLRCKRMMSH